MCAQSLHILQQLKYSLIYYEKRLKKIALSILMRYNPFIDLSKTKKESIMQVFHTSPESAITPSKWGSDLFGHAIFFSSEVYSMGAGKLYVHELDISALNIAEDCDFESDFTEWEWQADIAKQAFNAGFDGVKSSDEQGTCYMIDLRKVSNLMKCIGEL